MELNSGIIIAISNVHNKVSLEPACYKQHTSRRNTELNTCGIRVPSNVPTYKAQHPIQIYTFILYLQNNQEKMYSRSLGTDFFFKQTYPFERLYIIHMNLNYCIIFIASKHPSENIYNTLDAGFSSNQQTHNYGTGPA